MALIAAMHHGTDGICRSACRPVPSPDPKLRLCDLRIARPGLNAENPDMNDIFVPATLLEAFGSTGKSPQDRKLRSSLT